MASYHCFIQARYSSKRLRGKVLKKFGKLTLLEILVKRLSQSNQLKKIVILTSKSKDDKKIINFCKKKNINYFAGPLKNVFFRFKLAIKKYKPNCIINTAAMTNVDQCEGDKFGAENLVRRKIFVHRKLCPPNFYPIK